VRRPVAEDKAIAAAVEQLENARHPLLLIGILKKFLAYFAM